MKYRNIIISAIGAITLSAPMTSCTGDLDQYPHIETTSNDLYQTEDDYKAVLGKIYTSMTIIGQSKGGNADFSSNSGYDYMRCFFNMQECGTDEMASTWLSGDNVDDLSYLTWDDNDPWVSDMYYRIYWNIALCNEFLRHATADVASGSENLKHYRAEARFMRALFYFHALDLYRNIPFVDENDPVGSYTPPCYTPQQTFDFIESELNAAVNDLYPASSCPYGRASQGAAYTLLAKLYLNANVFIGTEKYTECITACNNAIAQGYNLESDYMKLFNADNDKRAAAGSEIIFVLPVDSKTTVSWGASTYVVCGCVSNASDYMVAADYGVASGWGSLRARGNLTDMFEDGDGRYQFFEEGQTQYITSMADQSQGYFPTKWTNLTDAGETASNTASDGVNTDYPLFRLADVYLMYAEAVLRGGSGGSETQAIAYVNALRQRAFGNNDHDITSTDFRIGNINEVILNERARELYFEGHRRTDLIRFGLFTTSDYIWEWKGGTMAGTSVDSKYNIYPIPATELTANPNLSNPDY